MDIGIDISSQLFPNPFTMLYTLLVTAVLFFFVYKFLFNPAREIIAKRADYVQSKLDDADKLNAEAHENLKTSNMEIEKAQKLSHEIVESAKKEAQDVRDSIVSDAKEKSDEILRKAHDRIKKEELELKKDISKEIVDVALAASEKLITSKELDKQDELSIKKFVEELSDESDK